MINQDPLLSRDEFKQCENNFYLHFVGKPGEHYMGDIYRKSEHYKKCLAAHPEAFGKLVSELQVLYEKSGGVPSRGAEYQEKLYQAYELMHPFATRNRTLFA